MTSPDFLSNYRSTPYTNRLASPRRPTPQTYDNYRNNTPDNTYNQEAQYLRKWYESRVRGLSEDIRNAFKIIQNDALIDTMRQDSASEEFISQRVKEIIDDCLANDRETLLEKMALQCSYLKSEFSKAEEENMRVKYFILDIWIKKLCIDI